MASSASAQDPSSSATSASSAPSIPNTQADDASGKPQVPKKRRARRKKANAILDAEAERQERELRMKIAQSLHTQQVLRTEVELEDAARWGDNGSGGLDGMGGKFSGGNGMGGGNFRMGVNDNQMGMNGPMNNNNMMMREQMERAMNNMMRRNNGNEMMQGRHQMGMNEMGMNSDMGGRMGRTRDNQFREEEMFLQSTGRWGSHGNENGGGRGFDRNDNRFDQHRGGGSPSMSQYGDNRSREMFCNNNERFHNDRVMDQRQHQMMNMQQRSNWYPNEGQQQTQHEQQQQTQNQRYYSNQPPNNNDFNNELIDRQHFQQRQMMGESGNHSRQSQQIDAHYVGNRQTPPLQSPPSPQAQQRSISPIPMSSVRKQHQMHRPNQDQFHSNRSSQEGSDSSVTSMASNLRMNTETPTISNTTDGPEGEFQKQTNFNQIQQQQFNHQQSQQHFDQRQQLHQQQFSHQQGQQQYQQHQNNQFNGQYSHHREDQKQDFHHQQAPNQPSNFNNNFNQGFQQQQNQNQQQMPHQSGQFNSYNQEFQRQQQFLKNQDKNQQDQMLVQMQRETLQKVQQEVRLQMHENAKKLMNDGGPQSNKDRLDSGLISFDPSQVEAFAKESSIRSINMVQDGAQNSEDGLSPGKDRLDSGLISFDPSQVENYLKHSSLRSMNTSMGRFNSVGNMSSSFSSMAGVGLDNSSSTLALDSSESSRYAGTNSIPLGSVREEEESDVSASGSNAGSGSRAQPIHIEDELSADKGGSANPKEGNEKDHSNDTAKKVGPAPYETYHETSTDLPPIQEDGSDNEQGPSEHRSSDRSQNSFMMSLVEGDLMDSNLVASTRPLSNSHVASTKSNDLMMSIGSAGGFDWAKQSDMNMSLSDLVENEDISDTSTPSGGDNSGGKVAQKPLQTQIGAVRSRGADKLEKMAMTSKALSNANAQNKPSPPQQSVTREGSNFSSVTMDENRSSRSTVASQNSGARIGGASKATKVAMMSDISQWILSNPWEDEDSGEQTQQQRQSYQQQLQQQHYLQQQDKDTVLEAKQPVVDIGEIESLSDSVDISLSLMSSMTENDLTHSLRTMELSGKERDDHGGRR